MAVLRSRRERYSGEPDRTCIGLLQDDADDFERFRLRQEQRNVDDDARAASEATWKGALRIIMLTAMSIISGVSVGLVLRFA